ncbi:hypothetical protein Drorol1_Dr00017637 [Drosera rotundifolia]
MQSIYSEKSPDSKESKLAENFVGEGGNGLVELMDESDFFDIGVDAAREDGNRLYWSVGASWGLGKLVEADFSCEFLKKYPKVDWGLHYGFGMSSVAVVL